jgi:hypothetical protein
MSKLLQSEHHMGKLFVITYCLSAPASLARADSAILKLVGVSWCKKLKVGLCVKKQMESSEIINERHGSYEKQSVECLQGASGK